MRSVYLQSVRSPGHPRSVYQYIERYRKRREEPAWQDVCSQRLGSDLEEEEDEYIEDSFCVKEVECKRDAFLTK